MPERSCDGCKRQEEWGCNAERYEVVDAKGRVQVKWTNPARMPTKVDNEELFCCPRQTLYRNPQAWGRLLLLYGMYKQGHLTDRGAVVDQSNSLLESFRILDEANNACDKIEQERERMKQARSQRGARR